MKKKKYLYTTGEFAQLNNLNKRTLHYYDEIGLFSPAHKQENGYRYYAWSQAPQLELILTLRRLGMSVEEIARYTQHPSADSFGQMIQQRQAEIDRTIQELEQARAFLAHKADKLSLSTRAVHGQVEEVTLPPLPLLLSDPITGRYDDDDFAAAAAFSLRLKERFGLYDNFGSRISAQNLMDGHLDRYDRFFCGLPLGQPRDGLRPGGLCLRACCIGPWDRLPEVYAELLRYAQAHDLTPCDYAYEEGLNEMCLQDVSDYVTLITLPCSTPALSRE